MGKYNLVHDQKQLEAAIKLARGCYQINILNGVEAISTATLRGKARKFSDRYKISSKNLLERCKKNGISIQEVRGENNKRILVIGIVKPEPAKSGIFSDLGNLLDEVVKVL
jgi:hypothetical protein